MAQHPDQLEEFPSSAHIDGPLTDDLTALLDASAPEVGAASSQRRRAVEQLVAATRRAAIDSAPRRRGPRAAVIAGAGALVLAGAGATAAAAGTWVPPWDRKPAVEFSFTLPSGTPCAMRVDSIWLAAGSPSTVRDVQDYLAGPHLTFNLSESDIIAAAPDESGTATVGTDGVSTSSHPVDPRAMNAADYRAAAVHAANDKLIAELATAGFDVEGIGGGAACQP